MDAERIPFGLREMKIFADRSDDPRVKAMFQRLAETRNKIAKWCRSLEEAEQQNARLRKENELFRNKLGIVYTKMDGEHFWRFRNDWPHFVGPDLDTAVSRAISGAEQYKKAMGNQNGLDA